MMSLNKKYRHYCKTFRGLLFPSVLSVFFFVLAMPVLAENSGVPAIQAEALSTLGDLFRWSGVWAALFVLFVAWFLSGLIKRVVEHLGDIFTGRRLLLLKISAFLNFLIWLVTIIMVVMLVFQFSKELLAIIGGTAAVAMGFAFRDILSSVIAGVIIMFDRPFQVGDRVNFGGQYGDIIAIGLRSVKLRTLTDDTVTIPNNMFLNEITSCGNYGVLDMQISVYFYIGLDQDIELACELIKECTAVSNFVYLPKPITVTVSQVVKENYIAMQLTMKAYVLDTKFEKAFETDVTLRVMDAFRKNNIYPPAVLHRELLDYANVERDSTVVSKIE